MASTPPSAAGGNRRRVGMRSSGPIAASSSSSSSATVPVINININSRPAGTLKIGKLQSDSVLLHPVSATSSQNALEDTSSLNNINNASLEDFFKNDSNLLLNIPSTGSLPPLRPTLSQPFSGVSVGPAPFSAPATANGGAAAGHHPQSSLMHPQGLYQPTGSPSAYPQNSPTKGTSLSSFSAAVQSSSFKNLGKVLFGRRHDSFHNESDGALSGHKAKTTLDDHSYEKPGARAKFHRYRGKSSSSEFPSEVKRHDSSQSPREKTRSHTQHQQAPAPNSRLISSSSRFVPNPFALLRKISPELPGCMMMMKTSKSLLSPYQPYYLELRGTLLLFFSERPLDDWSRVEEAENHLSLLADVAHCNITKPKANILRMKRDGFQLTLKFDSKTTCDDWEKALVSKSKDGDVMLDDFEILAAIGKGAAGKVFYVKEKTTGVRLAMKVIDKRASVFDCHSSYRHAIDERLLLQLVDSHPFFVQMRYAFQTRTKLYLITEFCDGGDLFFYLQSQQRPLTENESRRVLAEVVLALKELHRLGFVYRDLKPENILLDQEGHIRLADFGLSKKLEALTLDEQRKLDEAKAEGAPSGGSEKLARTKTVCGTHSYVAPEMVKASSYGLSVDLWTLGIFLYHILVGRPPYTANSLAEVKQNFETGKIRFYSDIMNRTTINFLMRLLCRDVEKRLGCGAQGIEEVRSDSFFETVDWQGVIRRLPHPDGLSPPLEVKTKSPRALPGQHLDKDDAYFLRNFNLDEWIGVIPDSDAFDPAFSDRQFWPPIPVNRSMVDPSFIVGYSYISHRIKNQGGEQSKPSDL